MGRRRKADTGGLGLDRLGVALRDDGTIAVDDYLRSAEAAARGIDCETTVHALGAVNRAVTEDVTDGFIEVVTAKWKNRILGATIVAGRVGELIGEYVAAMTHGLGLKQIMGTIHVYPTYAELNKFAASSWRRAHEPEWAFPWRLERLHRWLR